MSSLGMVAADGRLVLLNGKSGDQPTDWQEMREDRLPANGVLPPPKPPVSSPGGCWTQDGRHD
jgi:hypothetical protein